MRPVQPEVTDCFASFGFIFASLREPAILLTLKIHVNWGFTQRRKDKR